MVINFLKFCKKYYKNFNKEKDKNNEKVKIENEKNKNYDKMRYILKKKIKIFI